jgi:hypothetical protein
LGIEPERFCSNVGVYQTTPPAIYQIDTSFSHLIVGVGQ